MLRLPRTYPICSSAAELVSLHRRLLPLLQSVGREGSPLGNEARGLSSWICDAIVHRMERLLLHFTPPCRAPHALASAQQLCIHDVQDSSSDLSPKRTFIHLHTHFSKDWYFYLAHLLHFVHLFTYIYAL